MGIGIPRKSSNKEQTDENISSLMDAWIQVRDLENNGERNRGLYIMKSRGMYHSNQVREFLITSKGLVLQEVYLGPEGVLTGSARQAFLIEQKAAKMFEKQAADKRAKELQRLENEMEYKITALRHSFIREKETIENDLLDQDLKYNSEEAGRIDLQNFRIKHSEKGKKDD